MDLKWLCKESYRIAHEKGWHDRPRTFSTAIANFHREISEAWFLHARGYKYHDIFYNGDKPEGIPIELADLIIRIGDCIEEYNLGHNGWEYTGEVPTDNGEYLEQLNDFNEFICSLHFSVTQAWDFYKVANINEATDPLFDVIEWVLDWATLHSVDIEGAVREKMRYNETRSYRHGNKVV